MSEEQPTFKVTDRRLFNTDGTPREVEQDAAAAPPAATQTESEAPDAVAAAAPSASEPAAKTHASSEPAPTSQATDAARPPAASDARPAQAQASPAPDDLDEDLADGEEIPGADDPASFINFLMGIASNAAASLGMMEHPATGERNVDLQLGKHWIDVLGMMQEKTRGNLHPQEQQILEGLLADLRMQFVSLNHAAPPNASPRGFTGRDIIGGK